MTRLDDNEKATVLNAIRDGKDRATAARLVGRTGRQLRAMCNPHSPNYDPDFERGYLEAVAAAPPPGPRGRGDKRAEAPTTTLRGFTKARYLTAEHLDEFLERVAAGEPRDLAARAIGTSVIQIRHREHSDPDFAQRLAEAYEQGYPHYQDWLRGKVVDFIEDGNYNALRDQMLIHLPEADKLRTSKHELSGPGGQPIQVIKAVLHGLPRELIEKVIEAVEAGEERKAIEMLNDSREAAA